MFKNIRQGAQVEWKDGSNVTFDEEKKIIENDFKIIKRD